MKVVCYICKCVKDVKPHRINRLKHKKFTCSRKCSSILRRETMKGDKNHQYGLIGHLNSSFKHSELISNYGYILEYCPGHPQPHDKTNKGIRVKQHRLVVERNFQLFPKQFFEILNGWVVLKRQYDIHHINENRTDNRLENLEIKTRSEHSTLHNKKRKVLRNSKGQIIGVFKSDELLESPEAGNQQPSLGSDTYTRKVQSIDGENHNQ